MAGEPMNPATNTLAGRWKMSAGVANCWSTPAFITAIRVDIVITHLSPRVQAYLDLITITIGLIFAGLISWRLFLQAQSRVSNNDLTQIWEWPVWPAAWVMAIASLLMVTSLALHLGLTAKAAFGGTNNGPGASGPAPYSE